MQTTDELLKEIKRLKDYIKVNEFHSNARLNSLISLEKKHKELQEKYNRDVGSLANIIHSIVGVDTVKEIELIVNANRAYENFAKSYYVVN